jgi:1A family penicillin-binding protein
MQRRSGTSLRRQVASTVWAQPRVLHIPPASGALLCRAEYTGLLKLSLPPGGSIQLLPEFVVNCRHMRDLFRLHNPLKLRNGRRIFRSKRFKLNWPLVWRVTRILAVLGVFTAAALFAWYSKDLPTPGKIKARQAAQSTKILALGGETLYEVHGDEKRTVLKPEDILPTSRQATLAAEDRNFYKHWGFDPKGIARAAFNDIFRGQRVGGSTITQQYVKNAILTNSKSFDRKIKELILAVEIETMYSKDEILTAYLNEIPYGSNIYGIQAAAQTFFGKDAKALELHEAATLAAIPQRPTYFSPYGTHTDELKARRDWILDSMVELGNVTREDADAAKTKAIEVIPRRESFTAPHFVFYVREQLVEMFDEQTVEEGGLKVQTTLNLDYQKKAEQAVAEGMPNVERRGGSNAALVAVNPKTGTIDAMVGSHDFFDKDNGGNVNVTLASRQPGSSFKPIVYAAGFKQQYNPGYVLWDVPTDFGNYAPNNYNGSFSGPVSIRHSLANSLNIPAVKMLALVGLDGALKTAKDMGITTLNNPERYGLSLVLGGGEVRPLDMATAFGVFANGGTYRPPVSILKVESPDGKVLYEHKERQGEKEALNPAIAYQITSILADNGARTPVFGPRSALFFPDRPVAAKTGTTQEFHDGWTVGYTPSLSVAVWVGNNDNRAMKAGADGSVVAAPIFNKFIRLALDGTPAEEFARPNSVKDVTVDKLSNKLPTESSPEAITDLFAPWQMPKDRDDIHVKVVVNKLNGKLATEFTPESLRETRTYTVIHSERPDNPSWENPVIAWARNAGIDVGYPPKETDDYTEATVPRARITSPADGSTVEGNFEVVVEASAHFDVQSVALAVDNATRETKTVGPFRFTLNANALGSGSHTLTVTVTDTNGATASTTITVGTQGDVKAPADITTVSAIPQSGAVRLQWINPADSDLERVRIYVSTAAGSFGTKHGTDILVSAGSTSSFVVGELTSGTKYYFTLRPVDKTGNEAQTKSPQANATPF